MDRELKILKTILKVEAIIGLLISAFLALLLAVFSTDAPGTPLWIPALVFLGVGAASVGLLYFFPMWAARRLEQNPPSVWGAVLQGVPGAIIEGPFWFVIFPVRIVFAARINRHSAART